MADLKRRHIYRVAAVYAVVSWVIIQLIGNLTPMLRLPEWAGSFVLVLLLVCFPIALIFAWIHELPGVEHDAVPAATTRLDWALASGTLVVVAGLIYQAVAGSPDEAQPVLIAPASGGTSIAVLPLANLSGDEEQEFLSDGMTDEITAALGAWGAYPVDRSLLSHSINGQGLGSARDRPSARRHVSHRRLAAPRGQPRARHGAVGAGRRRLRALDRQLRPRAHRCLCDRGGHRTGHRGRAARAAWIGRGRAPRLEPYYRCGSYQDYLRGRALVRGRNIADAIATLESAVARDPDFAPAWAMLAQAYRASLDYNAAARRADVPLDEARAFVQSAMDKGERAARQAIELDPRHDGGYASLATILAMRSEWTETHDLFAKALAIDPNNPEALYRYGQLLNVVGRLGESLRVYEQLRTLEPLVPIYRIQTAGQMYFNGRNQGAIALLEATPDDSPARFYRELYLARAYAASGRFADSADALLALRGEPQASLEAIEVAAELIRAPRVSESPAALLALGDLSFVYAYVGGEDRLLEGIERSFAIGAIGTQMTFWSPAWAPARKTERFKAFVRDTGLVDYWRERGWPDLCLPQGDADFVCD